MRQLEEELDSTDITLGTGKLLGLFLGLVVICSIFFSLGYALGKNSGTIQPQMTEAPATLQPGVTPGAKPGAGATAQAVSTAAVSDCADGAACSSADSASQPTNTSFGTGTASEPAAQPQAQPDAAPPAPKPQLLQAKAKVAPELASAGVIVQVAAVSKREDADILVNALRRRNYRVFLANNGASPDNLFHVQVGPYSDVKDAMSAKDRLASDGYNPILKR